MKKSILLFTAFLLPLVLQGCGTGIIGAGDEGPEADLKNVIYYNSFENTGDLAGWDGYGTIEIREDAPDGGGNASLYVAGGCIYPNAEIRLPVFSSGNYTLQFWAKAASGMAGISLGADNGPENEIMISISDTSWNYYQSDESVFCRIGNRLTLGVAAGGFGGSAPVFIDLLKVVRTGR